MQITQKKKAPDPFFLFAADVLVKNSATMPEDTSEDPCIAAPRGFGLDWGLVWCSAREPIQLHKYIPIKAQLINSSCFIFMADVI